jgi:hypothetical protein
MKKNDISLKEQIRITLFGEKPITASSIAVTDSDMKKMRGVWPLYRAYKDALGPRVQKAVLVGNVLQIDILPDESTAKHTMKDFVSDLNTTKEQLCANANSDQPLPHSVSIRKPHLVAVLKAVQLASANYGLVGSVATSEGPEEIPVLEAAYFVQPDTDNENQQSGSFPVVGLRRDDRRGHRVIVTDNDLPVVLPPEDPAWTWDAIHDVLDHATVLVGTLVRESKAHPWTLLPGAKLVRQPEIEGIR